jgi:hypothetical protein
MLKVFVYGDKYQGFLDLPADTFLDMEISSEMFDEDLKLGEISLPLPVPWTDPNKKIFGFIEMLNTVPAKEKNFWRCDVFNDDIPEILDGKITLLQSDGDFNYQNGLYSFTISGNKGLFGSLIGKKTLRDLTLGKILFPAVDSRHFARLVMMNDPSVSQYPYLRFAPVAMLNFFDVDRRDYNNEFIAQDIVNNVVVNPAGGGPDDWLFGRPSAADTAIAAVSGTAEYLDYRTIPFFTYKWILQKLFEEFGYTLTGQWINDAAWDDAAMFNNRSIELYDTVAFTDTNREINIADHMPKKAIGIFLADFQKLFNVRLSFLTGRNISIDYRITSLKNNGAKDVTRIINKKFQSFTTDYKDKGFTLAFAVDNADSYFGDRVKEIDANKVVATVDKFTDLATLVIGRAFEYNDLVYVNAENQYYGYTNGVGPKAWDYFSERLMPFVIGAGDYKFETSIAPMATYIIYDPANDNLVNQDMVAADMKGSYFTKTFKLVENDFDTRIFFAKRVIKNGVNVASSFVNSRDRYNVTRVPKSLAWFGADGLYNYCWKDWLDFLTRTRNIKTTLTLNQKTYNELKAAGKISIDGTVYLPTVTRPRIPIKEEVEFEAFRL